MRDVLLRGSAGRAAAAAFGAAAALLALPSSAAALNPPRLTAPSLPRTFTPRAPALVWAAGGDAVAFRIYRVPGVEAPCETDLVTPSLVTLAAGARTFVDVSAPEGLFCYFVEAVSATGETSRTPSATVVRDVSAGIVEPGTLGFLGPSALVRFVPGAPLADAVQAQFFVRRPAVSSGSYVPIGLDADGSDGFTKVVPSAADGQTLDVRVVATNAAGATATLEALVVTIDTASPSAAVEVPARWSGRGVPLVASVSDPGRAPAGVAAVAFQAAAAGSDAYVDVGLDTAAGDGWAAGWDASALADGAYDVRAVAIDGAGNRGFSAPGRVLVDNTSPDVTLLSPAPAARVSGAAVPLAATARDAAGITLLALQVRPGGAQEWTTLRSAAAGELAVAWNASVVPDGPWEIRALALDGVGNESSDLASVLVDNGVPAKPAPPVALSPTARPPVLTWPVGPPGGDGRRFHVHRDGVRITAEPIAASSFTDAPPGDGRYVYTLVGVDAAGNESPPSDPTTVLLDSTRPARPSGVSVSTPDGGRTTIGWTRASDVPSGGVASGVTGYLVRSLAGARAPASPTEGTSVCAVGAAAETCTDQSAARGLRYSYSVFAVDGAGNVSVAASVSDVSISGGSRVDTIAPGRPTRLTRRVVGLRATLAWRNPTDADFRRVRVVVNATRRPRSPSDGLMAYTGRASRATVTLRPGRTLRVAIFAYDASGNASRPLYAALTAPAGALSPAGGAVVAGRPVLRWRAVAGATYYHVQLFRAGRRVTVAWPVGRSLRVPAAALRHGASYVWYVWPGIGPKAEARFGPLIGTGRFRYR